MPWLTFLVNKQRKRFLWGHNAAMGLQLSLPHKSHAKETRQMELFDRASRTRAVGTTDPDQRLLRSALVSWCERMTCVRTTTTNPLLAELATISILGEAYPAWDADEVLEHCIVRLTSSPRTRNLGLENRSICR